MDLNDRQQARQRAKQEKAKKRKKLLALVGTAALVLGLVIFLLVKCSAPPKQETPEGPPPEDTVIHFVAGGDLNITDKIIASGETGFEGVFQDVAPLLAHADLSVLNLEGNLAGAPYGSATGSAPQSLMQALRRCGVDMVQLANSYSINRGLSGLASTIDGVAAAGMEPVGTFKNESAYHASRGFSLFEVKGIKVAVVAFTKGLDGMSLPAGSESCVNLLYTDYDSTYQSINRDKINTIFDNIEKEKADAIIVLVHWGSEFNDNISSTQKSIVSLLQSRGADAIIGTHPHYVQKLELNSSGQFLGYSLGDFLSDADTAGTEYSVLLDLEITKSAASGETKVTGFSYTPLFSVATEDGVKVVQLDNAIAAYESHHISAVSKDIYDDMLYARQRIEARVNGK